MIVFGIHMLFDDCKCMTATMMSKAALPLHFECEWCCGFKVWVREGSVGLSSSFVHQIQFKFCVPLRSEMSTVQSKKFKMSRSLSCFALNVSLHISHQVDGKTWLESNEDRIALA
jgi:hypothetical protein